jgi:DNA-binding PadR family transcriptional regulator
LSHVSGTLRVLRSFGLVECANPEARKNRIYEISEEGVRTLRQEIPVPKPQA